MKTKSVLFFFCITLTYALTSMQRELPLQSPQHQAQQLFALAEQLENEGKQVEAGQFYVQSAQQGNADAQNRLGINAEDAAGQNPEEREAWLTESEGWYRKAAAQNHSAAQHNLGNLLAMRNDTTQNPELKLKFVNEAIKWYHAAASQDNIDALLSLGYAYRDKAKQSTNLAQKIALLQQATECFDSALKCDPGEAYFGLAKLLADELAEWKIPQERADLFNKTYTHYVRAFKHGNKDAADRLAHLCLETSLLSTISEKLELLNLSKEWCNVAMQQGAADLEYTLGCIYDNESDEMNDLQQKLDVLKKAEEWYLQAVNKPRDAGDAHYALAAVYEKTGDAVADHQQKLFDYKKAIEFYKAAAELGIVGPDGIDYELGCICEKAANVAQDEQESQSFLQEAEKYFQRYRSSNDMTETAADEDEF